MSCPLCDAVGQEFRLIKKNSLAFCTVNHEPLNNGHVMVLPTRHVTKLSDLDANESKAILSMIDEIKDIVNSQFPSSAIIEMNTGKHGSQEHLHFHILPSKAGLRDLVSSFENSPFRKRLDNEELECIKKNFTE